MNNLKLYFVIISILGGIACGSKSFHELVKLEGGLRRGDKSVLQPFLGSTNAANRRLQRRAPGEFTFPLIVAAETCSDEGVSLLIKAGADVNCSDYQGATPLMAVMTANSDVRCFNVASNLVKAGAEIGRKNQGGSDALHFAARYRTPEFVRLLLAAGADPNTSDKNGDTALHKVQTGTNALVLVSAGARIAVTNRNGQSPLDLATIEKKAELVSILETVRNQ